MITNDGKWEKTGLHEDVYNDCNNCSAKCDDEN